MQSFTVPLLLPPSEGAEHREALLDAAEDCFRRFGVVQTTIDDVVRAAKIPRATLYRHVGGKNDLIVGVVMRELNRFLIRLVQHISTRKSPADILVDGVLFAVEEGYNSELLRPILGQPQAATDVLVAALEPVRGELTAQVNALVEPLLDGFRQSGQLRPELTVEDAAEWLTRTIASLLTIPDPRNRTQKELRAFLQRVLVPVFIPDDDR